MLNLPGGVSSDASSCDERHLVPKSSCLLEVGGNACAGEGVADFSISFGWGYQFDANEVFGIFDRK